MNSKTKTRIATALAFALTTGGSIAATYPAGTQYAFSPQESALPANSRLYESDGQYLTELIAKNDPLAQTFSVDKITGDTWRINYYDATTRRPLTTPDQLKLPAGMMAVDNAALTRATTDAEKDAAYTAIKERIASAGAPTLSTINPEEVPITAPDSAPAPASALTASAPSDPLNDRLRDAIDDNGRNQNASTAGRVTTAYNELKRQSVASGTPELSTAAPADVPNTAPDKITIPASTLTASVPPQLVAPMSAALAAIATGVDRKPGTDSDAPTTAPREPVAMAKPRGKRSGKSGRKRQHKQRRSSRSRNRIRLLKPLTTGHKPAYMAGFFIPDRQIADKKNPHGGG